jgi:hypothetical protein
MRQEKGMISDFSVRGKTVMPTRLVGLPVKVLPEIFRLFINVSIF